LTIYYHSYTSTYAGGLDDRVSARKRADTYVLLATMYEHWTIEPSVADEGSEEDILVAPMAKYMNMKYRSGGTGAYKLLKIRPSTRLTGDGNLLFLHFPLHAIVVYYYIYFLHCTLNCVFDTLISFHYTITTCILTI
jgi:hypothetical protein